MVYKLDIGMQNDEMIEQGQGPLNIFVIDINNS